MSAAAESAPLTTRSSSGSAKKTSSMTNIVEASSKHGGDNGNCGDELLDIRHSDFVSLRKKSADDLLSIAASSDPFILSQGLSFTSGSILQSSSPPLASRRSPSPSPSLHLPQSSLAHIAQQAAGPVTLTNEVVAANAPATAASAAAAAAAAPATINPDSSQPLGAAGEDHIDKSGSNTENVSSRLSTASAGSSASNCSYASTTSNTAVAGQSASNTAAAVAATASPSAPVASQASSSSSVPAATAGKQPSKVSERAKKKAWYSVLYPSYKSRSEDFKKLFKGVPDDERLVVDYSCAVQRDILVHGRLYVSQNYLCFYANIFRWETCLSIRWKDVTAITKEKTALVIPNAILVSTTSEKYFITSFTSRDKAYLMLFRVWQNALMDKPMQPQEMWQWVHNSYGYELGLTSDDEDYIDPYETAAAAADVSGIPKKSSASAGSTGATKCSDSVSEDLSEPQSDTAPATMSTPARPLSALKTHNGGSSGRSKSGSKHSTSTPSPKPSPKPSPRLGRRSMSPSVALPCIGAGAAAVAVASSGSKPPHRKPASKASVRKQRSSTGDAADAGVSGGTGGDASSTGGGSARASPSIGSVSAAAAAAAAEQLPTDMSDSSDSESGATQPPFVCTAECSSMHEGRQLVHTILPINVDTLFALLFSKSKFLVDFHAHRKTTNMVHEDWVTGAADGLPCRKVNLTVALTQAVGPKCSHVTEHQQQRDCSQPGQLYSIDITSTNAGIPYADSFYVFMHYCLVRTVDDHTMFSVHAQIKYKKSVWGVVKGFIEKNTWAGLEDFYTALLRALQSEYCIPPAKAKGRRPRGRGGQKQGAAMVAADALGAAGGTGGGGPGALSGADGAMGKGAFALCSGVSTAVGAAASAGNTIGAFGAVSAAGGQVGGMGGVAGLGPAMAMGGLSDVHKPGAAQGSNRWSCTTLSMLLVVGALVLVNVILYLNLWRLQSGVGSEGSVGFGGSSGFDAEYFDFRLLKNSPKSAQEWLELLKRQEALHATETNKWQSILQTAVQLLRKTEQTLSDLLSLIDIKEFPPQQNSAYSTPVSITTTPTVPVADTESSQGRGEL